MAHHKSAKKRIRRNERANVRNSQYLSAVRTSVKKFRLAVAGAAEGTLDKGVVRPLFVLAQTRIAKAAAKGILHTNNARRRVSRLSLLLKKVEEGRLSAHDAHVGLGASKKTLKKVATKSAEGTTKVKAAATKPKKADPRKADGKKGE